MCQPGHQSVERLGRTGLRCILLKPLAKCSIECLMLRMSYGPSALDKIFVCAESDIFHTKSVYTIFVFNPIKRESRPHVG
jgi:hypothetical protein